MRAELTVPGGQIVSADTYNQLSRCNGTTMNLPVHHPDRRGLANYMVPLLIGARDMAFPPSETRLASGCCSSAA